MDKTRPIGGTERQSGGTAIPRARPRYRRRLEMKPRFRRGTGWRLLSHALFAKLFFGDSRIRITLLKVCKNLFSNSFNFCLVKRPELPPLAESINDSLKNAESELKIEDRICNINSSDRNAHDYLRLFDGGGWRIGVGDHIPRFRIVFVGDGREKRRSKTKNE